jgi:hypothetical protein
VIAGPVRDDGAAQHARDFLDPDRRVQRLDLRLRGPGASRLAHAQLLIRLGRHLWQVCHAQDLPGLRERSQLAAHHFRDGAADACIDLVEDQARQMRRPERSDLQGKADA